MQIDQSNLPNSSAIVPFPRPIDDILEPDFFEHITENQSLFLRYLGCRDYNELYEVNFKNGLAGDKFKNNNENILKNFYKDNSVSDDFVGDFFNWSINKTNDALKTRKTIAILNSLLLISALLLTTFLSPIVGILFGLISSSVCNIAEGVAKRNIANIGHLQTHIGNKIEASTKKMIELSLESSSPLNDEAKDTLRNLDNPQNYKVNSGIARGLSMFSGFVVGSIFNIVNRFFSDSIFFSSGLKILLGIIISLLPFAGYSFSRISVNYRNKTAEKRSEYFRSATYKIFHSQSIANANNPNHLNSPTPDFTPITNAFKEHMENSDCDGRISTDKAFNKNEKSDNMFNPTKAITLPTWVSSKIHRVFNDNFTKNNNKDLADFKGNINYNETLSAELTTTSILTRYDVDRLVNATRLDGNCSQPIEISSTPSRVIPANSIQATENRAVDLQRSHGLRENSS